MTPEETARRAHEALREYRLDSTTGPVLPWLDTFLERVVKDESLDGERVHGLARETIRTSSDREAIKTAIGLMGIFARDEEDLQDVMERGLDEELTLYSVVAITNMLEKPYRALFELAKRIEGPSRLYAMERLSESDDPEIQSWLALQ